MCDRQDTKEEIKQIYEDRYQIQKVLGEGGMGKVFLAQDKKTGKRVAVKIVKDQDQWKRERKILKKIDGIEGVPKLFFAGKENENFLVMEYIPGVSLKQYEDICGKLSEKEMIMWMIKVCAVLGKIHKKGIIHMDLKPENMILHPSGKIYLIDFGVSLTEGETLTGYGTRMYASKKQAKMGEKASFFMDIYSLGKIMQLNVKEQRHYHIYKVIQKCLSDDERNPYDTAEDIKKDLRNIIWIKRVKKYALFFISFSMISIFFINQKTKKKMSLIYRETYQRELNKAKIYFYGNDETKKDMILARQYFIKVEKYEKKTKSYLTLLDVLCESGKEISKEELRKAFKTCEEDIYDFWSAYFFEHYYVVWSGKLSKYALDEAENLIGKMKKYELDVKKQKILETEKLNLYELMAQNGDETKFFRETDRIFVKKINEDTAWEIYQRKILYLEEKDRDLENEFKRFIKHYPKVMEAYVEYVIYLCENGQEEKARNVYLEGIRQTGMSDQRAKTLRRKLGL